MYRCILCISIRIAALQPGFCLQLRQVWELTVNNATMKAMAGPARNAQNGNGV